MEETCRIPSYLCKSERQLSQNYISMLYMYYLLFAT